MIKESERENFPKQTKVKVEACFLFLRRVKGLVV